MKHGWYSEKMARFMEDESQPFQISAIGDSKRREPRGPCVYLDANGREAMLTNVNDSATECGTFWGDEMYVGPVSKWARNLRPGERLPAPEPS